jgi:hypothetical protein
MKRFIYLAGIAVLFGATGAAGQQTDPPPLTIPQQVIPGPPPEETRFEVSGRYTAQRRPRVTVLRFEDTNTEAQSARYGSSVEAMLVTFFKRKSQFVVLERQKLGPLLEEKRRIQTGLINLDPGDTEARELLEKLDAYILGSVTVLDIPTDQETAPDSRHPAGETKGPDSVDTDSTETPSRKTIQGPRIEVDAKLLSRFDGRIIAAAQRSGPVACLRSIVERLGIALEQEFLRPYYGKLKINLGDPENVRVYLTPILLDHALDEEKPPVERSSTVTIGGKYDRVEPWTTDPTSYTIENLLSGWYSMRLERPGYEGMGTETARWEARNSFGQLEVWDRVADLRLDQADPDRRRFVVHVDPLTTETIDGDSRKFAFRKKGGSLAPRVRRQYLDTDFSQVPQRVILMGGNKLDLNQIEPPKEYSDDERCDLFDERVPVLSNYGRTYVSSGQQFDFKSFTGGELIIEDYKGEIVPVGLYHLAFWEPYYHVEESEVTVRDQDRGKITRTSLVRKTMPLDLEATGARPASRTILEGRDTHHHVELPLDFTDKKEQPGLPVDVFTASTNISGLDAWRQTIELLPGAASAPVYDTRSLPNEPRLIHASEEKTPPAQAPRVTIKTRLGAAGRLDLLSEPLDPLAADVFLDRDLLKILNLLLYGQEARPEEERGGFLKVAAEVGLSAVRILADTPILPAPSSVPPPPASTPESAGSPVAGGTSPATGIGDAPPQEKTPPQPRLPRDPDELRNLLTRHLALVDLLILDPKDMAQLRRSPEVAAIIQRYIESGGSLFAFVSEKGDYGRIVGAPLVIEAVSKPTDRFELAPGEVSGILPQFDKKKVDVKSKRALPELAQLPPRTSWRVVAFTKGRRDPRIIEYGRQDVGGYVALWLDDPDSFRGRMGGTVSQVEETRSRLEERVLAWARYLMYRRYDKTGDQRRRAEKDLGH